MHINQQNGDLRNTSTKETSKRDLQKRSMHINLQNGDWQNTSTKETYTYQKRDPRMKPWLTVSYQKDLKETYKRNLIYQKRPIYISKERPTNETLMDGILQERHKRDLQKKPDISKETYTYQTRHEKETYKRDLYISKGRSTNETLIDIYLRDAHISTPRIGQKRHIKETCTYKRDQIKETFKKDTWLTSTCATHTSRRPVSVKRDI